MQAFYNMINKLFCFKIKKKKNKLSVETGGSLTITSVHAGHWNKKLSSVLYVGSFCSYSLYFNYTEYDVMRTSKIQNKKIQFVKNVVFALHPVWQAF